MTKIINVTCKRCYGSGNFSFNLIRGTVCFGCNGVGTVQTTEAKINAAKKGKIKSDAKKAEQNDIMIANIASYNLALAARIEKYKNDPRLGAKTKARCEEFPSVADQTYLTLELVDAGKYPHSIGDLAK